MTVVKISSLSAISSTTAWETKVASVAPSSIVKLKPIETLLSTTNSNSEILLLPSTKYSTSPGAGSLLNVTGRNKDKPPSGAGWSRLKSQAKVSPSVAIKVLGAMLTLGKFMVSSMVVVIVVEVGSTM